MKAFGNFYKRTKTPGCSIRKYLYFLKQMKYNTKSGENQLGQIQSAMIYCTSSCTKPPHRNSTQKLENPTCFDKHFKSKEWEEKQQQNYHTNATLWRNIGALCYELNHVLTLRLKEDRKGQKRDILIHNYDNHSCIQCCFFFFSFFFTQAINPFG